MGQPTVRNMRKVSTRISLSMPRRLTWTDIMRLPWIYCFMNHYSIPLSPWYGIYCPRLACADCLGWSGPIRCVEVINIGFLVERLIYMYLILNICMDRSTLQRMLVSILAGRMMPVSSQVHTLNCFVPMRPLWFTLFDHISLNTDQIQIVSRENRSTCLYSQPRSGNTVNLR